MGLSFPGEKQKRRLQKETKHLSSRNIINNTVIINITNNTAYKIKIEDSKFSSKQFA